MARYRGYTKYVLVVVVIAVGALLVPRIVASRGGVREVRLVARDMTYYIEGSDAPNPTLRFTAGEQVRLVLTNDDPGFAHDFTIRAWNVTTKILEGKGTDSVTFRVPATAGSDSYQCTPHAQMMTGSVIIE